MELQESYCSVFTQMLGAKGRFSTPLAAQLARLEGLVHEAGEREKHLGAALVHAQGEARAASRAVQELEARLAEASRAAEARREAEERISTEFEDASVLLSRAQAQRERVLSALEVIEELEDELILAVEAAQGGAAGGQDHVAEQL